MRPFSEQLLNGLGLEKMSGEYHSDMLACFRRIQEQKTEIALQSEHAGLWRKCLADRLTKRFVERTVLEEVEKELAEWRTKALVCDDHPVVKALREEKDKLKAEFERTYEIMKVVNSEIDKANEKSAERNKRIFDLEIALLKYADFLDKVYSRVQDGKGDTITFSGSTLHMAIVTELRESRRKAARR